MWMQRELSAEGSCLEHRRRQETAHQAVLVLRRFLLVTPQNNFISLDGLRRP
jgi:hypothetical protein